MSNHSFVNDIVPTEMAEWIEGFIQTVDPQIKSQWNQVFSFKDNIHFKAMGTYSFNGQFHFVLPRCYYHRGESKPYEQLSGPEKWRSLLLNYRVLNHYYQTCRVNKRKSAKLHPPTILQTTNAHNAEQQPLMRLKAMIDLWDDYGKNGLFETILLI